MKDVLLATLILIGVALLILIIVGGCVVWKVARSEERRLARRIGRLRLGDKLAFGRDLMRDPRVPWWAKLIAMAVVDSLTHARTPSRRTEQRLRRGGRRERSLKAFVMQRP